MAFIKLTQAARTPASRVLISGAPITFKTTSLLKWPRPLHILSYPGEKGWETIPRDDPDLHAYAWQIDDVTKVSAHAVLREIEAQTAATLSDPAIVTFAGEGLHKLYGWYYRAARLDMESNDKLTDDVKDARSYGIAHETFGLYLTKVLSSRVPYVVMTVWEGRTPDDPEARKSPTHIFPDLPGMMARRIVGEFPVVLYSEVGLPDPAGKIKGEWQIRPSGKVWGVGIKVDPRLAVTFPAKIPQDFETLKALLSREVPGTTNKEDTQ